MVPRSNNTNWSIQKRVCRDEYSLDLQLDIRHESDDNVLNVKYEKHFIAYGIDKAKLIIPNKLNNYD